MGNRATWLARVTNVANWTGDDTGISTTSVGVVPGVSAIALPVHFGVVNAFIDPDETLTISWQTLSETENSHFEAEVSNNGESFEPVAVVISKAPGGNSATNLNYTVSIGKKQLTNFLGLGLLTLLVLPAACFKRHRRILIALMTLCCISWLGCSKENAEVNTTGKRLFVRITQVDKDGNKSFSKVVTAFRE